MLPFEDHEPWIVGREKPDPHFSLLDEMWVERGDRADWDLLCALHYKMATTPVGAKYWRLRFRGETIGVMVLGMSRPLLKERHAIFPGLTPGKDTQISNIHRYKIINDGYRVVGRFVIDTMFRSGGAAYRFLNLASRQTGFRIVEIQSSMSKYNLFAQKAGFSFAKPIKSANHQKGLRFMRGWFEAHPGDQESMIEEFHRFPESVQRQCLKDLKEFYFSHSPLEKTGSRRHYSHGVVDAWSLRRTIGKIQGLCFTSPLYGFYRNPDYEHETPHRLPLGAFECQGADEPLNLPAIASLPHWGALERQIDARNWSAPTILPEDFKRPELDPEEEIDAGA